MKKIVFLPLRTLRRTSPKGEPSLEQTSQTSLSDYVKHFQTGNCGTSRVENMALSTGGLTIMFVYLVWIFLRIDISGELENESYSDPITWNEYGEPDIQLLDE